jgi:hypothetical protein
VPSVEKVTSDSVGAQIVIEKKNAQDNEITSYEVNTIYRRAGFSNESLTYAQW